MSNFQGYQCHIIEVQAFKALESKDYTVQQQLMVCRIA